MACRSWRFSGDAKDWIQASYTLHIERSGRTTVHTINSQASVHVPWPEAPLTSREIARVTVVATGEDGSQTKPAAAVIEAALLHRSDWSAQMISGEAQPKGAIKRPYYFERTFVLDHIPQKARVYATAFGIYKLTLNGKAVGADHVSQGRTPDRFG
jgi:alpha-L-rhamnosidase